jgi:peroxiredoxin
LQADKAKFDQAGALILGVNNNSVAAHQSYCRKKGFGFPILADVDLAVAKAYGAEKGDRVQRTVVVIAPDGLIKYYKHGMPTDDEILKALG